MSKSTEGELARIRQALSSWRSMEREALTREPVTGRDAGISAIYISSNIETISEILGDD